MEQIKLSFQHLLQVVSPTRRSLAALLCLGLLLPPRAIALRTTATAESTVRTSLEITLQAAPVGLEELGPQSLAILADIQIGDTFTADSLESAIHNHFRTGGDPWRSGINQRLKATAMESGLDLSGGAATKTPPNWADVEIASAIISGPVDLTFAWQTSTPQMELDYARFDAGGGAANSAKAAANNDIPLGVVALSEPSPQTDPWIQALIANGVLLDAIPEEGFQRRTNVWNTVDGNNVHVMADPGSDLNATAADQLLNGVDAMLAKATNLKWFLMTAGERVPLPEDVKAAAFKGMIERAHAHGIPVFIDFKFVSTELDIHSVFSVDRPSPIDILAPNSSELIDILNMLGGFSNVPSATDATGEDLERLGQALLDRYNFQALFIKRGPDGMMLVLRDQTITLPGIDITDLEGSDTAAGDSANLGFLDSLIRHPGDWHAATRNARLYGTTTASMQGSQVATPEMLEQTQDRISRSGLEEYVQQVEAEVLSALTRNVPEPLDALPLYYDAYQQQTRVESLRRTIVKGPDGRFFIHMHLRSPVDSTNDDLGFLFELERSRSRITGISQVFVEPPLFNEARLQGFVPLGSEHTAHDAIRNAAWQNIEQHLDVFQPHIDAGRFGMVLAEPVEDSYQGIVQTALLRDFGGQAEANIATPGSDFIRMRRAPNTTIKPELAPAGTLDAPRKQWAAGLESVDDWITPSEDDPSFSNGSSEGSVMLDQPRQSDRAEREQHTLANISAFLTHQHNHNPAAAVAQPLQPEFVDFHLHLNDRLPFTHAVYDALEQSQPSQDTETGTTWAMPTETLIELLQNRTTAQQALRLARLLELEVLQGDPFEMAKLELRNFDRAYQRIRDLDAVLSVLNQWASFREMPEGGLASREADDRVVIAAFDEAPAPMPTGPVQRFTDQDLELDAALSALDGDDDVLGLELLGDVHAALELAESVIDQLIVAIEETATEQLEEIATHIERGLPSGDLELLTERYDDLIGQVEQLRNLRDNDLGDEQVGQTAALLLDYREQLFAALPLWGIERISLWVQELDSGIETEVVDVEPTWGRRYRPVGSTADGPSPLPLSTDSPSDRTPSDLSVDLSHDRFETLRRDFSLSSSQSDNSMGLEEDIPAILVTDLSQIPLSADGPAYLLERVPTDHELEAWFYASQNEHWFVRLALDNRPYIVVGIGNTDRAPGPTDFVWELFQASDQELRIDEVRHRHPNTPFPSLSDFRALTSNFQDRLKSLHAKENSIAVSFGGDRHILTYGLLPQETISQAGTSNIVVETWAQGKQIPEQKTLPATEGWGESLFRKNNLPGTNRPALDSFFDWIAQPGVQRLRVHFTSSARYVEWNLHRQWPSLKSGQRYSIGTSPKTEPPQRWSPPAADSSFDFMAASHGRQRNKTIIRPTVSNMVATTPTTFIGLEESADLDPAEIPALIAALQEDPRQNLNVLLRLEVFAEQQVGIDELAPAVPVLIQLIEGPAPQSVRAQKTLRLFANKGIGGQQISFAIPSFTTLLRYRRTSRLTIEVLDSVRVLANNHVGTHVGTRWFWEIIPSIGMHLISSDPEEHLSAKKAIISILRVLDPTPTPLNLQHQLGLVTENWNRDDGSSLTGTLEHEVDKRTGFRLDTTFEDEHLLAADHFISPGQHNPGGGIAPRIALVPAQGDILPANKQILLPILPLEDRFLAGDLTNDAELIGEVFQGLVHDYPNHILYLQNAIVKSELDAEPKPTLLVYAEPKTAVGGTSTPQATQPQRWSPPAADSSFDFMAASHGRQRNKTVIRPTVSNTVATTPTTFIGLEEKGLVQKLANLWQRFVGTAQQPNQFVVVGSTHPGVRLISALKSNIIVFDGTEVSADAAILKLIEGGAYSAVFVGEGYSTFEIKASAALIATAYQPGATLAAIVESIIQALGIPQAQLVGLEAFIAGLEELGKSA